MIDIDELIEATAGRIVSGCARGEATGVSIDTRTINAGEVFFAIKGPRFDGTDFIDEAFKKGALAAVVPAGAALAQSSECGCVIELEDTVRALGYLGAFMRRRYRTPLVAISGSVGKTTTKEMIASILSRDRSILKTEGNRNNLIGLPLTLTGLSGWQSAAVVELGISVPGEMARLVEIADPDVALITNIRSAHSGNFRGIREIAREKGLLYGMAGPGCIKAVNLDDPLAVKAAGIDGPRRPGMDHVTFSAERMADVRVVDRRGIRGLGGVAMTLDVRGQVFEARLNVPGLFNVENAIAAIAAALPLGVYLDDICEGLEAFRGLGQRMEVLRLGWITLVDDTYNASPESLGAALETLQGTSGRKVAVIGGMHELGAGSERAHMEAGERAVELGMDIIVAVGEEAHDVASGAARAGAAPSRVFTFDEKEAALGALLDTILREGDVVLVKGSRAAGLEFITEGLKNGGGASREACG